MDSNKLNPCSEKELKIRENFKRDYKLSCPVLDDNDIFNKCLSIGKLDGEWKDYYKMTERIEDLDEYRRKLRNQILGLISSVNGFDQLKPIDIASDDDCGEIAVGPKSYMDESNIGKRLLSIDLVCGNYQSLKYLGDQYVLDTANYDELIRKFTDEESLVRSKMFRQMIFGQLKPDVQASVQRKMLNDIIFVIKKRIDLKIVHLTNDEVIFHINSDSDIDVIKEATRLLTYQFRIKEFTLFKIANGRNEPWFVKDEQNGVHRILGVHVRYLLQVYNFVYGIENKCKDFWWREQGRLSTLLEPEEISEIC